MEAGGPVDLRTYDATATAANITSLTLQQYAAYLKEPGYGAQRAMLDTTSARANIEHGILPLASNTITTMTSTTQQWVATLILSALLLHLHSMQ